MLGVVTGLWVSADNDQAVWRFGYWHMRALHQELAVKDPLECGPYLRPGPISGIGEAGFQRPLADEDIEAGQGVGSCCLGHDESSQSRALSRRCRRNGPSELIVLGPARPGCAGLSPRG